MKIKVTPVTRDPDLKKLAKSAENYFNVATPKKLNEIWFEVFSLKNTITQRKVAYQKHQKTIETLKPLFKKMVVASNEYANAKGYRNFLEFSLDKSGTPKGKLKQFKDQVDAVIDKINRKLPQFKNKEGFYSIYNIPDYICETTKERYPLPEYVIDNLKERLPALESSLPKIKFEKRKGWFDTATFDKDTQTVTVRTRPTKSLHEATAVAHELGHAIAYLQLAKKSVEPKDRPKYWHEKKAIQAELAFINSLPSKLKNAVLGEILTDFADGLFEIEVYTNPNQEFDKAYAASTNRCYKEANQAENPFYVLAKTPNLWPCRAALRSLIYSELLSH